MSRFAAASANYNSNVPAAALCCELLSCSYSLVKTNDACTPLYHTLPGTVKCTSMSRMWSWHNLLQRFCPDLHLCLCSLHCADTGPQPPLVRYTAYHFTAALYLHVCPRTTCFLVLLPSLTFGYPCTLLVHHFAIPALHRCLTSAATTSQADLRCSGPACQCYKPWTCPATACPDSCRAPGPAWSMCSSCPWVTTFSPVQFLVCGSA